MVIGTYTIILIGSMVVMMLVGMWMKSKMNRYFRIPLKSGLTGREVAARMLQWHGINDVKITCTPGRLTDHYNPQDKTVNLSKDVYEGVSIASASVAAHEVGHAVQHAVGYKPLEFRSKIVPIQAISSQVISFLLMGMFFLGYGMYQAIGIQTIAWIMVAAYGGTTLFALVTLPVEFDASKRAAVWLQKAGLVGGAELRQVNDGLNSAAMTYVANALSSLVMLIFWLLTALGNRD